jgi:hypothetical protein
MHTAVLGPNDAAVHDRGVLGQAPALFVAGGFLFSSRRVQGALSVPKMLSVLIYGRIAYPERDARSARFCFGPPRAAVQVAEPS